jgi:nitroreductase
MKQELSSSITQVLEYARLAPSVHNAQPWKFTIDNNTISLVCEPARMLVDSDPTGRESWISFGICLEAIMQAAKGLGLKATIVHQQTASFDKPIASVKIAAGGTEHPDILAALKNRYTYREKMVPAAIPKDLIEHCEAAVKDLAGIKAHVMTDKQSIAAVGALTKKAMSLALGDPGFRTELFHLIRYNWSPARTGLHGYAMGEGWLGSVFAKWSVKLGIGLPLKARHDEQRIVDASALIFISAPGDVSKFWFTAGRGYLRVALEVTKSGLVQGTLAAPIEAASFHEDIEAMLGTKQRLQTMIRVGKPTRIPKRKSPRLDLDDLT